MRLKGDFHDVHHITAYDNRMLDVDLFVGKYGEPDEFNQGFHLNYTPGNINTKLVILLLRLPLLSFARLLGIS